MPLWPEINASWRGNADALNAYGTERSEAVETIRGKLTQARRQATINANAMQVQLAEKPSLQQRVANYAQRCNDLQAIVDGYVAAVARRDESLRTTDAILATLIEHELMTKYSRHFPKQCAKPPGMARLP